MPYTKPLSNSYFFSKWGMGCYYFGGGGYGNKLFLWDGVLDTELPNCNCAAPGRLPWAGFFLTSTSRRKKTDENDTKKTGKSQQSLSYYCDLSGKEINHLIKNAFRSSTSRRIYSSMSSAFCSVSALKAAVTNTYHQQNQEKITK